MLDCWNSPSDQGLAFADPAKLDGWNVGKMGDWKMWL